MAVAPVNAHAIAEMHVKIAKQTAEMRGRRLALLFVAIMFAFVCVHVSKSWAPREEEVVREQEQLQQKAAFDF